MGDQGKTSRRGLPGRGPAIVAWTACAVALGALIGGGVLLLQTVLPLPNDSPAAVAASTLAMAALFRPLRNRIQTLVDRRFHRATYNAVRIIEVFAGNLRRQTDLDNLTQGLVAVVHRTVKPQHVSVWLMEAKEKSS